MRSLDFAYAVDYDRSSVIEGDLLLSLLEQNNPLHFGVDIRHERASRPFPYTRSKTRWRKRPNDEIKYLRARVIELENLKSKLSNSSAILNLLDTSRAAEGRDVLLDVKD